MKHTKKPTNQQLIESGIRKIMKKSLKENTYSIKSSNNSTITVRKSGSGFVLEQSSVNQDNRIFIDKEQLVQLSGILGL